MTTNRKQATQAATTERQKVEELSNQYVRLHKWSAEVAKDAIKKMTPSELQAFADHCITHFDMFNYMTAVTKDRVEGLAELLPEEIFSKIWSQISNSNGLREKMEGHVRSKGKPDFFNRFLQGQGTAAKA